MSVDNLAKYEDFVPDCIVQYLIRNKELKQELTVPTSRKIETVSMFADISGYTMLSEKLASQGSSGTEKLVVYLNNYWESLVRITTKCGGDVFKYVGDAVVVIWSSLSSTEWDMQTSVHRAAQCAYEIQKELHNCAIGEDVVFRVKCGIGCGANYLLIVGGEFHRLEYLLCGPALLQAFDCEERCNPGDVVLSLEAWQYVKQSMKGTALPAGCVKLEHIVQQKRMVSLKRGKKDDVNEDIKAFVPGAIIPYMKKDAAYWAADLRTLSILFVNVGLKASKLIEIKDMQLKQVQDVLVAVQASLYDYEGSLNKFLVDDKGSTLLACFGLPPLAHEDDPTRAVLSALTLVSRLESLGYRPYVGITTGIAHCGCLGAGSRKEYGVLGDVVNTAARLMQMASKFVKANGKDVCGSILLDQATKDSAEADPRLRFISLQPVKLKGKAQPVPIYHVYYPHTDMFFKSTDFLHEHLIDTGSMIVQMNEIKKRLYRLTQPKPQSGTIMITGDIGTGKSIMLEKIREYVNSKQIEREQNLEVLSTSTDSESFKIDFSKEIIICDGKADSFNMSTRCFVWKQLIFKLLHHTSEEKKAYFLEKIEKDNLFSTGKAAESAADIESKECELVIHVINTLTNPLLILIDQCQWMSDRDWSICYYIASCQRSENLLMILATRPLHSERYAPAFNPICREYFQLIQLPDTGLLQLDYYSCEDVKLLIESEMKVNHVNKDLTYMVDRFTGGNPLFICKWLKALHTANIIQKEVDSDSGESYLSVKDPRGEDNEEEEISLPIPYRITRTISTYLDRLKPMEFLLVKTAAVIATGGGCFTGCFELAFVAHIFPKRVANEEYAQNFMELVNTLQLFNLIVPYTMKDSDTLSVIQTTKVPEAIEPLQNRFYTFTAIVIRNIIYHKMLHDQRKRLHNTALEYIKTNLIQENVPLEMLDTYKIHFYRHTRLGGDTVAAHKYYCKLCGIDYRASLNTNSQSGKEEKIMPEPRKSKMGFKSMRRCSIGTDQGNKNTENDGNGITMEVDNNNNNNNIDNNGTEKESFVRRLFSCFHPRRITPTNSVDNNNNNDKKTAPEADQSQPIQQSPNLNQPTIAGAGFGNKTIALQCSNSPPMPTAIVPTVIQPNCHQPVMIQSTRNHQLPPTPNGAKALSKRPSTYSNTSEGIYAIDEIMNLPFDEDIKTMFIEQEFICTACVVDRMITKFLKASKRSVLSSSRHSTRIKSTIAMSRPTRDAIDDDGKEIILSLGFGDNKEIRYLFTKLDSWDFDVFNCNMCCEGEGLKFVASSIFQQRGLLKQYNIDLNAFHMFLNRVENAYHKDNPYHNVMHVTDVLQTVHCFLSVTGADQYLSTLDIFSVLTAAILHDIDHPGVTYDFMCKTNDERTVKYNFKWCLEAYHADLGLEYMSQKLVDLSLLDYFTPDEQEYMKNLIKHLILFTSLEFNMSFINEFREYFSPDNKINYDDDKSKEYIMTLFIKASDISNPAKSFSLYKSWANALINENYKQGDREMALGMDISPNMERGKADIAIVQMKFMRFIVHPLYFAMFDYFASVRDLCKSLLASNFAFWVCQEKSEEERNRRKSMMSQGSQPTPTARTNNNKNSTSSHPTARSTNGNPLVQLPLSTAVATARMKRGSCATMMEYSKTLLKREETMNSIGSSDNDNKPPVINKDAHNYNTASLKGLKKIKIV